MASKAKTQKGHAKRRALTRFGVSLNDEEYKALVRMIQRGKAKLVGETSLRVKHYEVTLKEKECVAIYDKKRKTIVSFLFKTKQEYRAHLEEEDLIKNPERYI